MQILALNYHGSIFHFMGWKFVYKNATSYNTQVKTLHMIPEKLEYEATFEFAVGVDVVTALNDVGSIESTLFVLFYSLLYGMTVESLRFELTSSNKASLILVATDAGARAYNQRLLNPRKLEDVNEHIWSVEADYKLYTDRMVTSMFKRESLDVMSPKDEICKAYCEMVYSANPNEGFVDAVNITRLVIPDAIFEDVCKQVANLRYYKGDQFGMVNVDNNPEVRGLFGSLFNKDESFGGVLMSFAQCIINFNTTLGFIYESGITGTGFVFRRGAYFEDCSNLTKLPYSYLHHPCPYFIHMTANPMGLFTSGDRATYVTEMAGADVKREYNNFMDKDDALNVKLYKMDFANGYDNAIDCQRDIIGSKLIVDWSTIHSDGLNPFWLHSNEHNEITLVKPSGHIRIVTRKQCRSIPSLMIDTKASTYVEYVDVYISTSYSAARSKIKTCGVKKRHLFYPTKTGKTTILYKSIGKNSHGRYNYLLLINNTLKIGELDRIPDKIQYTPMEVQLMSDMAEVIQMDEAYFYQVSPTLTVCTPPETIQ